MGMFDDLIPNQPQQSSSMFDDLIPKKQPVYTAGRAPQPNDASAFKAGPATPMAGIADKESAPYMSPADVNRDVTYSVANIPRDLVEAAVALPGEADALEKKGVDYLKGITSPESTAGRLVRGYEGMVGAVDQAVPINKYLPNQQQVEAATEKVLPHYESKTAIGQGIRTGGDLLIPFMPKLGVVEKLTGTAGKALQTSAELGDLRRAQYAEAKAVGGGPTPQQYSRLVKDMEQTAKENLLNPERHPQATADLNLFKDRVAEAPEPHQVKWSEATGAPLPTPKTPPTHMELDQLRQDLNATARTAKEPRERFQAGAMLDTLDRSLEQMLLSNPALKKAHAIFRLEKQVGAVENLFNDAAMSAKGRNGDMVGALRDQFANKSKSNKSAQAWMRQFDKKTQSAIRSSAGGPGHMEMVLRALAKDKTWAGWLLGGPKGAAVSKGVEIGGNLGMAAMDAKTMKGFEEIQRIIQKVPSKQRPHGSLTRKGLVGGEAAQSKIGYSGSSQ